MRTNKTLILIFLFALFVRLGYVFFFTQIPLAGDGVEYDKSAWDITQGRGFPVKAADFLAEPLRAPGYLLTLAFFYKVFGHNLQVIRFFQAVISSLVCVFIYFLSMYLIKNRTLGFISSTACAVYFPFVSYAGLLSREAILPVFLTLSTLLLLKAFQSGLARYYIFTGLAIGVSVLFDERMTYFPIFVIFILLFLKKIQKKAILNSLIFFASVIAIISPWTIRNYLVFKEFIPVTRGQTACFWLSTHPSEPLEWRLEKEPLRSLASGLSKEELFKKLSSESLKNLKGHPFIYAKLSAKRFFRLWLGSHSNSFYGLNESFSDVLREARFGIFAVKTAMFIVNLAIILFGAAGILIARHFLKKQAILITLLPVIYLTILHTFSFSTPRYAVPMMPIVIFFASLAILKIFCNGLGLKSQEG